MTGNISAIVQINELNKLFAEIAPLYVAKYQLDEWLENHQMVIAYNSDGRWRVFCSDYTFLTNVRPDCEYATYGEALIAMLDECIARELLKHKDNTAK